MCKNVLLMIVAALVVAGAVPGQTSPKWLLVRSEADKLGSMTWERLAKHYLRSDYRIVQAKDADCHKPASRLVAGTPKDNALVASLAKKLGVRFEADRIRYRGKLYAPDSGVAIVTADPDGAGTLVLFAGATGKGALACLSVPVDLGRHGWVVMTWQHALRRGKMTGAACAAESSGAKGSRGVRVDGSTLRIVRLDAELWRIRDRFGVGAGKTDAVDEAALRASRAFAGYQFVFDRAAGSGTNLLDFTRRQFREQEAMLQATRKRFAGVDLDELLRTEAARVEKALGGRHGPEPVVYTIVTRPGMTNAQTIGEDPQTGRIRVVVNLAALSSVTTLRVSAAHEFTHTLQRPTGRTLVDRAMMEGVAVFVSQQLHPGTTDHDALMWTEDKFAAANSRRAKILAAFERFKDSNDTRRTGQFLYGGSPLRAVPGAPDRCAYWVGWSAAVAWRKKNPDAPLGKLLDVEPGELYAALQQ